MSRTRMQASHWRPEEVPRDEVTTGGLQKLEFRALQHMHCEELPGIGVNSRTWSALMRSRSAFTTCVALAGAAVTAVINNISNRLVITNSTNVVITTFRRRE